MEVQLHELTPVMTAAEREAAERQQQQRQQRQLAMSDARRALVLDSARSVFAEKGVEGASIREIARRAGYTPGAIYSYFDSKEAIYAALLAESLERLNAEVAAARSFPSQPQLTLAAKAQAWFGYCARSPRDLDLGFYLVQGLAAHGLAGDLARQLNGRLQDALRPCEVALQGMGLSMEVALRENTALFAHGVGLLLLHRTGRMGLLGQSAESMFATYVELLIERFNPGTLAPSRRRDQADLFGL